ncbi:MAG: ribonuclease H family protein [bacterium]
MNQQQIEIYTDGSCHTRQKSGAWASILLMGDEKIVIKGEEKNTTHNRMELLAVLKAIEYLDKKQYDAELIIYTDSQYVCGIPGRKEKFKQRNYMTNKGILVQNADLVKELVKQIESHCIQFIKIKAHQKLDTDSCRYNNQVDRLSRKTMRSNCRNEVTGDSNCSNALNH